MKMRSLSLCVFVTLIAFTSCKKDSTPPTPTPTGDPELLGPQTDKVLHYSFNGNLSDGSGNSMSATSSNNISYTSDRFGRANQAAVFGGPSNISYIAVPTLSAKVPGFPFSISLWFKTSNVTSSQTLVKSDGGETATYSGYWLQSNVAGAGTMSFSFGDNTSLGTGSRNSIHTPAVFSANTWYHVVVNVRAANDMDFYINGVKNNNCTYDGYGTTMAYTSVPSVGVIGVFPGVNSAYEGLLDDYRIYKKILTQTEVSALYNFQP